MDQITQSLQKDFSIENGLTSLSSSVQFEHFTGYLVTQRHYSEIFLTDEIIIDSGGGDIGIDSLSIIVNGQLVTEPEEIDDYAEANGYLDVSFVFNQAETSNSFETAKIGQFAYGVSDFFSSNPKLTSNESVKHKRKIWEKILEHSKLFKKGNPQCFLYYCTTGKWVGDKDLVARRDSGRSDIESTGLFRHVSFDCLGAHEIQALSRQSKNSVTAEITFTSKIALPEIPGVKEAYLGVLPASEFLKIILNDTGEIRTSIFYDNVRHWQDWNPVNQEIAKTIGSDNRIQFPLLNNGVTIVARRVHPTGHKILLEDYQIVNGCQTSFVLYHNKEKCDPSVMIPLRVISTDDEMIKSAIIHATNRQTEVPSDQFFALADFPKKLEEYFPTFEGTQRLYYERRPGQYNAVDGIERVRIINMTVLVRAFASMFLELPHRTTRNYKSLLQDLGKNIFNAEHKLDSYYVAAFANYRMEYLFRNGTLPSDLKPARYHLLLALRLTIDASPLPWMNSKDMVIYCDKFKKILWDNEACKKAFKSAEKLVRDVAAGKLDGDSVRTESFTGLLLDHAKPIKAVTGKKSIK